MVNKKIDVAARRKILRKKRRRQKQIFRLSLFLLTIFSISTILILATITKDSNTQTASAPEIMNTEEDLFTVCIDPGHGGWDVGTEGVSGSFEKDITLKVALKVGRLLEKNGIRVIYTRTNDSMGNISTANDSLKERINISKVFKCDLFVSIHCNSNYDSKDSKGVETWYNPNDSSSKELATILQEELVNLRYTTDRGLKTYSNEEDALAVIEKNTATATLIELGFLSNTKDEYYLSSNRGQTECAEYINKAIIKYKNKFIISNENTDNPSN